MFGGVKLKLTFTHEKTCFAYISSKFRINNEQAQCIQVLYKDKPILLWAVFNPNIPDGHLACNPVVSKLVGLKEGAEVFVSPYSDVKMLDELYVDTDSPEDQEILEHNADILQLCILDQLRLVVANQKAVIWISPSLPIKFTPKQTGLLVNHSRIIVKIDAFNTLQSSVQNNAQVPQKKDVKYKSIGLINEEMLRPNLNVPKKLVLRAVPIDTDGKKNLIHPYTVFIHEDLLDDYVKNTVILATMKNIPSLTPDKDENETEDNNNQIEDLCVEIVPINNVIFRSLCKEVYNKNIPTGLIPKSLNTLINIENGTRIIFTIIGDNIEQPEHIDLVTYSEEVQSEMEVIEKFKNCVIESTNSGKKFLINDNMIKQNLQITPGHLQIKLKPDKLKYTLLNSESFRYCTVAAKCLTEADLSLPKPTVRRVDYDFKNYCRSVKCIESLVAKVLSHLYFEIHREANFKGASEIKSNVLVTGLSGTGKSSLCHIIQKELTVYSHILHCRTLKGRKDVLEVLSKAILMCQERSPAVLVCDDLDSLVPAILEGASPQDVAYYQRLATSIKHVLQTCAGVSVLMTSLSMAALHPTLKQFNGKPMFTAQFDIPELNQDERAELFKHFLNDEIRAEFTVEDDDVIKMAMETGGCTVRDLTDYLNKKIFKAVKKKKGDAKSKPRLVEDITKDEEKSKEYDIWGPIGGLAEVKQRLTECIFWPMMYPALFPSQSCGILLYGPPGTGKSQVGQCLSRAAGFSLLAVKGPELLSKYIGQSEKAVRDVFDKAETKRPCILFFDEFDSLAPKRGHDSTGVTDRVVNQLLARLDGAEGGAKGPVIAATSRPDLVDPALLRPGRLQTHLYFGLPNTKDRLEILKILSESVSVAEEVDLESLALATEGYSPADLKSLLTTAQLSRLEKQLATSEDKTMESVTVQQEDVNSALSETKPSLSFEQRMFYDMIYRKFRGEELTPEQRLMSMAMQKQRVTLA